MIYFDVIDDFSIINFVMKQIPSRACHFCCLPGESGRNFIIIPCDYQSTDIDCILGWVGWGMIIFHAEVICQAQVNKGLFYDTTDETLEGAAFMTEQLQ